MRIGNSICIHHDDGVGGCRSMEHPIDRPAKRSPLPPRAGLVTDENFRAGGPRERSGGVRAVVGDDDHVVEVRRVRLGRERADTARDQSRFVVRRDEDCDALVRRRAAGLLRIALVEERSNRDDDVIQGEAGAERTESREQDGGADLQAAHAQGASGCLTCILDPAPRPTPFTWEGDDSAVAMRPPSTSSKTWR